MFTLLIAIALAAPASQADRCAHADHPPTSPMICVNRLGHCVALSIDGQPTVPLRDEAEARRVHAIPHDAEVCWHLQQPVGARLQVTAQPGGLRPDFVGATEKIGLNLYALDDYDPEFDSRLDDLQDVDLEAVAGADGAWQLTSERPLPAGEYVAVFRVFGVDNWDKQAVLLRIGPGS
jgi:hypothetical protein